MKRLSRYKEGYYNALIDAATLADSYAEGSFICSGLTVENLADRLREVAECVKSGKDPNARRAR